MASPAAVSGHTASVAPLSTPPADRSPVNSTIEVCILFVKSPRFYSRDFFFSIARNTLLSGRTMHVIPVARKVPDKVCFYLSRWANAAQFLVFFGCSTHLTCPSLHYMSDFFAGQKQPAGKCITSKFGVFALHRRTCAAKGARKSLLDINHRFHEGGLFAASLFFQCSAPYSSALARRREGTAFFSNLHRCRAMQCNFFPSHVKTSRPYQDPR